MQAAAQALIDSSISKTVNCPEDISFEDFADIYVEGYHLGCKGLTTYRPNAVTGSILKVDGPKADPIPVKAEDALPPRAGAAGRSGVTVPARDATATARNARGQPMSVSDGCVWAPVLTSNR